MQLLTGGPTADHPPGRGELAPRDTERRVSRLAIASLASSILWAYGLGSLLGIALGILALKRLPATAPPGSPRGRRAAVAGLVLGVLGFVVTVILFVVALQAVGDLESPM